MPIKTLADLAADFKRQLRDASAISIGRHEGVLTLALNTSNGERHFEVVSAVPKRDLTYASNYAGIFSDAYKTFLDPSQTARIQESTTLEAWRSQVEDKRKRLDVERYNQGTYFGELVWLEQKGITLLDIETLLHFFADTFRKKIQP